MAPTLTDRLLQHPSTTALYERATQSAFLSLAGQGRLPTAQLEQWLAQDRLYAQAYVRFIGGLMSRVRLPASAPVTESREWRVLEVLRAALDGIATELRFFEGTALAYGLDVIVRGGDGGEAAAGAGTTTTNAVTARYVALFDSFGADAAAAAMDEGADADAAKGTTRRTLLEGLLVLWATETVYLAAWTYAKEQGTGTDSEEDQDGGALRTEFIPNWTSEAFQAFVRKIKVCLDEYAATNGGEWFEARALELWTEVLELEEQFWPNVNLKDVVSTM